MKNEKTIKDVLKTEQMIAAFMSASAPIESYLQGGKPLTDRQLEMISLTVSGLQTFLDAWKRKRRPKSTSTFLSLYGPNAKKT